MLHATSWKYTADSFYLNGVSSRCLYFSASPLFCSFSKLLLRPRLIVLNGRCLPSVLTVLLKCLLLFLLRVFLVKYHADGSVGLIKVFAVSQHVFLQSVDFFFLACVLSSWCSRYCYIEVKQNRLQILSAIINLILQSSTCFLVSLPSPPVCVSYLIDLGVNLTIIPRYMIYWGHNKSKESSSVSISFTDKVQ